MIQALCIWLHAVKMTETAKKKQRLPNQGATSDGKMLDGQIVKYQPLIDEAAKEMLWQILKMTMLESLINLDNHLIENFQSLSETFESRDMDRRFSRCMAQIKLDEPGSSLNRFTCRLGKNRRL
ncbi:Inositol-tetrakisphosphate 1-kinase [Musa troglodytarum]|uniref:Inositol-tetrakisphosphate 1-kinase n=1 Tax=Musa troglodytarum TaxID=320322 RepID=A0A9E7F059_9LILI|nr:Inositol-tetrakisphosphate 1-kinase [Musa troglodytarum]